MTMELDKKKIEVLWQEKMSGDISEENENLLKEFMSENPLIAKEFQDLEQTWALFDEIERPEPSEAMDARFQGMMAAYQSAQHRPQSSILDSLATWLHRGWQVGFAALVLGLLIGWWALPSQNQQQDIQHLSEEIHSMKEMMMLTLIEQPKAQERIRAVNLAAELPKADEKVINALIATLNHDENLNVRLASLESLVRYADQAEVRQALIDALNMQDSPLMLVAIADILVAIQEKSSVEEMEKLRDETQYDIVKEKLDESIETLKRT